MNVNGLLHCAQYLGLMFHGSFKLRKNAKKLLHAEKFKALSKPITETE